MPKFMAVLHGKQGEWAKFPEAKQKELIGKYMAWAEMLKAKHEFSGGSELSENYRTLKTADGPFVETKEILTGYFIFRAGSLDEAAGIARSCPAFLHGDWVQVFEMPERKE